MSDGEKTPPKSFIAETAIGYGQAVKFGTQDNHVVPTSAAGEFIVGQADEAARAGFPIGINTQGIVRLVAQAAITRGQACVPTTTAGRVSGVAANNASNIRALALESVAAARCSGRY